jgi:hypothetical protein
MRFPPRFSHLATRSVVVTKLAPMCALAHDADDDEASERLDRGLKGPLLDDLLAACWQQLTSAPERPSDDAVLEQVAAALKKHGGKPGKTASVTPGWNAFLVLVDVRGGVAGDAARRVLETDEGKKRVAAGMVEVARHLATELTRK